MRYEEDPNPLQGLRLGVIAFGCAALLGVAGCGEDDFENSPRPPSPIELTAAIDRDSVTVSPGEFGAGLVVVTISNQTSETTQLVLEGPTNASSGDIPPNGTGSIRASLEEGSYQAATGAETGVAPAVITVGPERPSSQNDLLLP